MVEEICFLFFVFIPSPSGAWEGPEGQRQMREWQSPLAQICKDRWSLGLLPSYQQMQVELSPSSVLLLLQMCLEVVDSFSCLSSFVFVEAEISQCCPGEP